MPIATDRLRPMANAIRALAMDAVQAADSGHPGMPMGMADAATVLWGEYLKHDPAAPGWPDRDRFVLSAGHGSMLIYALLHPVGLCQADAGRHPQFSEAGQPVRRASGELPARRGGMHHRPAGARLRHGGRHGDR